MRQRKLLLLLLVLLLISVGLAAAQSSTNYVLQRFVIAGGGASDSPNYTVTSVIGQQDTDVADSANYSVSAGFLHPLRPYSVWLPVVVK